MTTRSNVTSAYRSHATKRLAQYLRIEAERVEDALYVTGDRLAEEIGDEPKEIERRLRELSGSTPGLTFCIEPKGPRTVWRISRSR